MVCDLNNPEPISFFSSIYFSRFWLKGRLMHSSRREDQEKTVVSKKAFSTKNWVWTVDDVRLKNPELISFFIFFLDRKVETLFSENWVWTVDDV